MYNIKPNLHTDDETGHGKPYAVAKQHVHVVDQLDHQIGHFHHQIHVVQDRRLLFPQLFLLDVFEMDAVPEE